MSERILHPFPPLFDSESRTLILGSFPSVKSREAMFFYGHPQNRFWRLTALLCHEDTPQTIEEKSSLILRHHLALWDSIQSCTITGSSDSSVRDVVPNDLRVIFDNSKTERVFCNGAPDGYCGGQTAVHQSRERRLFSGAARGKLAGHYGIIKQRGGRLPTSIYSQSIIC